MDSYPDYKINYESGPITSELQNFIANYKYYNANDNNALMKKKFEDIIYKHSFKNEYGYFCLSLTPINSRIGTRLVKCQMIT